MKLKGIIIGVVILALVFAFYFTMIRRDTTYDAFASCLSEKGALFYGAYWCPHCKVQKEAFGDSIDLINYVECADETNPRVQTPVCVQEEIESYPTWIFADGSRVTGEQTMRSLAAKTGCELPE